MKRLDLYLLKEMIVPFLIGQSAVALMLTGSVLYNNADVFLSYQIPASGILKITFYFLPYLVNLTMPVAMAVAASLAISRLSRDSEITALRAAGISLKRIFLPIFVAGLALSALDFYFGEKVVPWSNRGYQRTMEDLSRNLKFLVPKEREVVQSPDKKYTAYVGQMQLSAKGNTAKLSDILFLISAVPGVVGNGTGQTVIEADSADYVDGLWTLYDAKAHFYRNGGLSEVFTRTPALHLNFRISPATFNLIALNLPLYSNDSDTAADSFADLGKRIAQEKRGGYVNPRDILDYQFKLSVPFSCLVFALACPPLSLKFARAGSFMGVLLSIILVFVYWNTLLAAKIIGNRYYTAIPPLVAAWAQNLLFAALGLFALWREE